MPVCRPSIDQFLRAMIQKTRSHAARHSEKNSFTQIVYITLRGKEGMFYALYHFEQK